MDNENYQLCSKDGFKCAQEKVSTNKDIHDIASSWRVDYDKTLFEKPMIVNQKEKDYHEMRFSIQHLERAKAVCGNVC